MNESEKSNTKRSMSMSPRLNADLIELCDKLGISVHAYLTAEVAKIIHRDRALYLAEDTMHHVTSMLKSLQKATEQDS
jgi:hypothetical protein